MIWGGIKEGAKQAAVAFVTGKLLNRTSGAKMQSPKEVEKYANARNKGLLLDGASRRLSETDSFQNVCVIARVGAGKTSRYIIPNVIDRARHNCSVVVNDPKGEVFEKTSGYMQAKGFKVIAINPEDLTQSSSFNPLWQARDDQEIEQIAQILIRAGAGKNDGGNQFWNDSATRLVSILLKLLNRAGQVNRDENTLGNLYRLLQNFGSNGSPLDEFAIKWAFDPAYPDDESLWDEWQGAVTGAENAIAGVVQTALTALQAFTNQNLVKLTARSSINLEDLRRQKIALYFITPPQLAEYYGFWTSLFFRSVFNAAMRRMPDRRTLPLYVLYDEFGHSTIPHFGSIANTIRGYKVSLSIILQSMAQLSTRYGKDYAQAIQGGLTTYMTYAGSDQETAKHFEAIAGKVVERNAMATMQQHTEYNLLNADEVRRIEKSQAILLSSNQNPALLETLGYFENRQMRGVAKRYGQARIAGAAAQNRPVRVNIP